jgi:hypothetical protein
MLLAADETPLPSCPKQKTGSTVLPSLLRTQTTEISHSSGVTDRFWYMAQEAQNEIRTNLYSYITPLVILGENQNITYTAANIYI